MMSMNSAYVDELYFEYLKDPSSVSADWQTFFATYTPENPAQNSISPSPVPATPVVKAQPAVVASAAVSSNGSRIPALLEGDAVTPLSSIGGKIAQNMEASLNVPTATSVRSVPVKALEENRRIANIYLARNRRNKLSFTHILAWAVVKAAEKYSNMKNSYGVQNGTPVKIERGGVNLGLAVDTTRKDGSRILLVPSIKNVERLSFDQFADAYDDVIKRARTNKLTPEELSGANITLTNPGGIGTVMSVPRLMEGQGTIVAAGAIEYPAEFQAMMPDVLSALAISKVVTITSTYDHRVIQGAESGEFLQYVHKMLLGENRFYEQIFAAIGIPFEPLRWTTEKGVSPFEIQDQREQIDKEGRVVQLINAYRVRGHLLADVNPLGLEAYYYPELDPGHYDFTIWDLDREFDTGGLGGVKRATLRQIIDMLRDTYCDHIGIEYMYIQDPEKKNWIREYVEYSRFKGTVTPEQKLRTYRKLSRAETLENFLHTKFLGAKRFSLEGGESTLIILDQLLAKAARTGAGAAVLGMAHRGRLNVLVNMMGKPLEKLFKEFEGKIDPESYQGSGDVKYHLGAKGTYATTDGATLPVILAPNPSHLEAVNPVVEGIARALDDELGDASYRSVVPILIHGDAAFAGQGVVPETLNMACLRGYSTGGTMHIVINNQIGFTTSPEDSRSSPYCTGVAKLLQVPILHVDGDDPEACRLAANFASAYREKFNDDVVIDMLCYRKYGHNEQDDPTATQPLQYKKIRNMVPVRKKYEQQLIGEGVADEAALKAIYDEELAILAQAYDNRANAPKTTSENVTANMFAPVETCIPRSELDHIANVICSVPDGFNIHAKVKGEIEKRKAAFEQDVVQWGMAEALAYGSLLRESHSVRITGQDTGRGTFNHRQAVHRDNLTDERHIPLNEIGAPQKLHIHDSPLSEYAVLGFEYGYSTIAKNGITLWEAQFGDFANGAQIMFDQFIASAEEKWMQCSNITCLLPHGYDGQGPEHSSARLERFLQSCAQDNMIVCNFTSPANFFHAIRRQVKAAWRKPLIVMSPKGYLRVFQSTVHELEHGAYQEIIDDASINASNVRRVVICTGKVYNELLKKRTDSGKTDVALVRLEQIYPFHASLMTSILARYSNAKEIVWCQEEPKNMGAWFFVQPLLQELLQNGQTLRYVGRAAAASPATGSPSVHEQQQNALLEEAVN
ncbi:MAG: multifunctional oxoglutarate decarboxylase/oxoglutarate dehydrogenase thiamine pyrophosphate-binding subunit/dihydrolipoyllysine-residue succinyltransferase subunit [Ignavibacteria bacterium]|nr:multifunctional oxoglutarate decarboxylase/oxoglutarate dehydrogenase thiamine pyrophosphate-binding subunit/dihydrolipoyllysine-residue succinyltransferase subunit [Ignavibacteria bacterium]